MKAQTRWILFVLMVGIYVSCDTSSNVEPIFKKHYIKLFGGDGDNEGKDLIVNPDNTFVLLGSSVLQDGSRKIYVLKTDSEGNVLWEKRYGNDFEYPQDIERISTGYIILSNIDIGNNQFDFKLIRIDNDGNKTDSTIFNVFDDQFGYSVTELSDGGFYVAGNTSDTEGAGNAELPPGTTDAKDLMFIRFDNMFVWGGTDTTRVGGSSDGSAIKVFETSPENFMSAEYSNLLIPQDSDDELNFAFRNFSHDPANTSQGFEVIGDNGREERMNQSVRSSEGNFYSIGTSVGSASSSSIFITKTRSTPSGVIKLFESSFGVGRLEGVSIFPGNSSCYVLANIISEADGTRDIWLTKINSFNGDQDPAWLDGITIGSTANDDSGSVVAVAPNRDILILGTMNLTTQKKIALIRVTSDGKFVP
jgi:hypothetical protein